MSVEIKVPKKLIEVAIPLDAINDACAYEKLPGIGAHPRGIHLWWARRPLAAARAIIFAQLVNDPGYEREFGRGVNKEKAQEERDRLFRIIEQLVTWDNRNNTEVLALAKEEIWKSWRETCALNRNHPQANELFDPNKLPAFHDPFSGGGAIPLEAQRLGLESFASDLNPISVLINKSMIEIPPLFTNAPPVGPNFSEQELSAAVINWSGNQGLSEDIKRYGKMMVNMARKKIGHLYPKVTVSKRQIEKRPDISPLLGKELPVIAYLWARTVRSPNPAFSHVQVPLVSSFVLSNNEGKEAFVDPLIKNDTYSFRVKAGPCPEFAQNGTKSSGANFRCILSEAPITAEYIRSEAQAGRMGQKLLAIVAEGPGRRLYLAPDDDLEKLALSVSPDWKPDLEFYPKALGFRIGNYGMRSWADIFTQRQLTGLSTLSQLISEIVTTAKKDAASFGLPDDDIGIAVGGRGALAYAQAIATYLAFAIDRCADFSNTCVRWVPGNQKVMNLFGKQTVSMTWDFPEAFILEETVGGFLPAVEYIANCVETLPYNVSAGKSRQESAMTGETCRSKIISTDPPYYDNIGYADLSDFFYVWLKRSLSEIYPDLFSSIQTPKSEELVATPGRHGGKENAEFFFLHGMTDALKNVSSKSHPAFPVSIYYAFKQSETSAEEGTSSTGWETFLEAIIRAGFAITGTWPIRSEQSSRIRGMNSNALASSVVIVCRKRQESAPTISRRDFIRELKSILPEALEQITVGGDHSPVAPVDLGQAIIGPGMAIFTKYAAVLEADGAPMTVRAALQLINRSLAEDDFDRDTQFCINWFDSHCWKEGRFGDADVLARSKGTSVDSLRDAGIVESSSGNLRIFKANELPDDWNYENGAKVSTWELLHHIIRQLNLNGETGAGKILAAASAHSELIRILAYRLYTLCERRGWAQEASQYDQIIKVWESIEAAAQASGYSGSQISMFNESTEPNSEAIQRNKKTRKKKT